MAEGGKPPVWQDLVRPPYVVPEVQKLPPLLREFQRRKVHIAVVVDEYGETCGIVTLEDVLEELFGEIREERDREEREIVRRPDGSSLVLGKTPIRHFNEVFGTEIPDLEFDTVAGFLLHEFGRMPAPGEKTSLGGDLLHRGADEGAADRRGRRAPRADGEGGTRWKSSSSSPSAS